MTERADGNAPPPKVHSGMSQRRLRRRRSPPRIISLTEGVGTDIPMKNIKSMKPVPRITPKLPKDIGRIPRPVLLNTVRYRPEKRTELPPSTRTSVQTLAESKTVPKIRVPRVRNRLPRGAQFRPDVASARIPVLSQIESIANGMQQSSASMKQKTSAIRGSGLSLVSGETHLWKLTNKGGNVEISIGPVRKCEIISFSEDLDSMREIALPSNAFLEGCTRSSSTIDFSIKETDNDEFGRECVHMWLHNFR